ncbi:alcohol dehydrogenase-like 2 isoform X2 [Andrographis paniculata]|uniref:alcohol dehydrogenase-like 2 isoform X2 n=1 Tax=Andrographis paniculata TaxID=175694 RepID=UPI0021E7E464|nr:alcohol dehydrogenase-like 2 isoform X2 [Andrographis paniculata]
MESRCSTEKTVGKSIRCRAAVARKAGEPLIIEEIDVLPPMAWEVRIRILCTSLCHSDVTMWKIPSGPATFFPRIFGHEAAGVVESVGDYVEEFVPGDLVLPVFERNCGDCRDCRSPKGNACSKFAAEFYGGMPRDGSTRFLDAGGNPIHHFLSVSSFSEFTVVDVAHVVKMNPNLPPEKACLLSCGVTTVWKTADVEEGSTVAIFGLGTVGLAVAEGARLRGASKIIGVDINPNKFEIGKKFGVTHFINPTSCTEKTVCQMIKELTGEGADYCFECIGLAPLMNEAFVSSRKGCGKTIIIGVEMTGTPLSINTYVLLEGRGISGCRLGGYKPKSDIPMLANKYIQKEINLDKYISHEINFEEINKAFEMLKEGTSLRCIVWMDR